jgi:hypothetical protein
MYINIYIILTLMRSRQQEPFCSRGKNPQELGQEEEKEED